MKILVSDHGLCLELAITLARARHSVGYYVTPVDKHSLHSVHQMGSGFNSEGVERCYNYQQALDSADIVVFPDTHSGYEVDWLRAKGYKVFGAGSTAEWLENDRWYAKEVLGSLPHNRAEKVVGVENLVDALKKRGAQECFVKCSGFREIETFKHETWETTLTQFIAPLLVEYGTDPTLVFILEEPIEPAVEVGSDNLIVNGQWPLLTPYGYEAKDSAYIGKFNVNGLPMALHRVNQAITVQLKDASTFVSTEVRITPAGLGFPVDLTIRAPHPPMAAMLEALKGLPALIVSAASNFGLEMLETHAAYAAVLVGTSGWADDHRMELVFDDKLRQWVKMFKAYKQGGSYYVLPSASFACCVVGIGTTVDQAVKGCKMTAEQVHGRELSFDFSSLDKIVEETIPQGKKCGIPF